MDLKPREPGLRIDVGELVFHGFTPGQSRAIGERLEAELQAMARAHFASRRESMPGAGPSPGTPESRDEALSADMPAAQAAGIVARGVWHGILPSLAAALQSGYPTQANRIQPADKPGIE